VKAFYRISIVLTAIFFLFGCQKKEENIEITISAAASLKEALYEIKEAFEKDYENITINLNFGGSGTLKHQISQGAPVDLFFSAGEKPINELVNENLLEQESIVNVISNTLVLIVPKDENEVRSLQDLMTENVSHIAIGNPDTVPAGQYAKEALENVDVWKGVENKLVFGKDVRQVLSYVETGNVEAGIVYKTDAIHSKHVSIAMEIDETYHSPIIYPIAIVKNSEKKEEANLFLQYICQEKGMNIFQKYGFRELKEDE